MTRRHQSYIVTNKMKNNPREYTVNTSIKMKDKKQYIMMTRMNFNIIVVLAVFGIFVLMISVHEYSHMFSYKFGGVNESAIDDETMCGLYLPTSASQVYAKVFPFASHDVDDDKALGYYSFKMSSTSTPEDEAKVDAISETFEPKALAIGFSVFILFYFCFAGKNKTYRKY